jgi:hypothetical protein
LQVSPCSIARPKGKAIENIACALDGETPPTPQEVKEGAEITYT